MPCNRRRCDGFRTMREYEIRLIFVVDLLKNVKVQTCMVKLLGPRKICGNRKRNENQPLENAPTLGAHMPQLCNIPKSGNRA